MGTAHAAAGHTPSHLSLRVPVDSYERDTRGVCRAWGPGRAGNGRSTDVSEEVADVARRVASVEKSVKRLQKLLEVGEHGRQHLEIEEQLSSRHVSLEALAGTTAGRPGRSISYAAVDVELALPASVDPAARRRFSRILQGLAAGWRTLLTMVDVLVVAIGWLLPFTVVAVVVAVPLV